jgi:hypothetical protein
MVYLVLVSLAPVTIQQPNQAALALPPLSHNITVVLREEHPVPSVTIIPSWANLVVRLIVNCWQGSFVGAIPQYCLFGSKQVSPFNRYDGDDANHPLHHFNGGSNNVGSPFLNDYYFPSGPQTNKYVSFPPPCPSCSTPAAFQLVSLMPPANMAKGMAMALVGMEPGRSIMVPNICPGTGITETRTAAPITGTGLPIPQ